MSLVFTAGRILGQTGAYAFEGTRLASTQLAAGAVSGYTERAALLREQRLAIARDRAALAVPELPAKQKRVAA